MSISTLEQSPDIMASTTSVSKIIDRLDPLVTTFHQEVLFVFFDSYKGLGNAFLEVINHFLGSPAQTRLLSEEQFRDLQVHTLEELDQVLSSFTQEQLPVIQQYLSVGCHQYIRGLQQLVEQAPDRLLVNYPDSALVPQETDSLGLRRKKWSYRMKKSISGKPSTTYIPFRKLLEFEWQSLYLPNFQAYLNSLTLAGHAILLELERLTIIELQNTLTPEKKSSEGLTSFVSFLDEQQEKLQEFLPEFHQLLGLRLENELQQVEGNRPSKPNANLSSLKLQRIKKTHQDWYQNQLLAHEVLHNNLDLQKVSRQIEWLNSQILKEIDSRYLSIASLAIQRINDNLSVLSASVASGKEAEHQALDFDTSELLIVSDNRITESGVVHLRQIIKGLEESVAVVTPLSWENLAAGKSSLLDTEEFPLAETVNYFTKAEYMAPVEKYLKDLPSTFKKIHESIQAAVRLLFFNLKAEESTESDKSLEEVMQQVQHAFARADSMLEETRQEVTDVLAVSQQTILGQMSLSRLVQQSREGKLVPKQRISNRGIHYYRNQTQSFFKDKWDWINGLWRRTQDERLLAEFESNSRKNENTYTALLDFVESCKPEAEVQTKLPFYYKQLFTGRQRVTKGMLAHCEAELVQARLAVARMKEGTGGGLLIMGEALSGKSFFSEYVAELLFSGAIYRISPPVEGSIRKEDFRQAFRRQINRRGSIRQLIQSTRPGSVFLLDDLELWWERSEEGELVLDHLFDLIEEFGREYFFLANCNIHFYRLYSHYSQFDIHFTTTIRLSPFPSEALRQTILDRHASGRFGYALDGIYADEIGPGNRDLFFSRILSISKGNIGFALRLWLRQIKEVKGDMLYLQMPEESKLPGISNTDWLVLLAQFVLHKRLTIAALLRIFEGESEEQIQDRFYPLLQLGLIRIVSKYVYEISPDIQPFIVQQLLKAKII